MRKVRTRPRKTEKQRKATHAKLHPGTKLPARRHKNWK